jgi:ribonuclease-3
MSEARQSLDELQRRLGYEFRDTANLINALTHSSAIESGSVRVAERLEFLGDAVVGLVLSELLVQRYPSEDEGRLSKLRAALVSTVSLATKARELGLNEYMTLGKGEEKTGGRQKESILADAYEAVIGAIFLEVGYDPIRTVIKEHFAFAIEVVGQLDTTDAKTELQELCQSLCRATPIYRVVNESGPDHDRRFVVDVIVGDNVLASGEGRSKRTAEQQAALRALRLSRGFDLWPVEEADVNG